MILNNTQKDRDKRISLKIVQTSSFEKDLSFVEEYYTIPDLSEMQHRFEIFLDLLRLRSDIAACHLHNRTSVPQDFECKDSKCTLYRGFFAISATPSAVRVLPVPGPPWSSKISPFPFPGMTSVDFVDEICLLTIAVIGSFVFL